MVKRILYSILTFFLVTVLIFGLFLLMPQDPIKMKLGDEADPVFEAALRYKHGFTVSPEIGAAEVPPVTRYFRWLGGLFRLDLQVVAAAALHICGDHAPFCLHRYNARCHSLLGRLTSHVNFFAFCH